MVKVTFTSHNKEIYCNKGDKLLDVARNADIFIDAHVMEMYLAVSAR